MASSSPTQHVLDTRPPVTADGKTKSRSDLHDEDSQYGSTAVDAEGYINQHVPQNVPGPRHLTEADFTAMQDAALAGNPRVEPPVMQPLRPSRLAEIMRNRAMTNPSTPSAQNVVRKSRVRKSKDNDQSDEDLYVPFKKKRVKHDQPNLGLSSSALPSPFSNSPRGFSGSSQGKAAMFDREYVNAHPNETFHHRGKGKWARGLPPLPSGLKMAVSGPEAAEWKARIKSSG